MRLCLRTISRIAFILVFLCSAATWTASAWAQTTLSPSQADGQLLRQFLSAASMDADTSEADVSDALQLVVERTELAEELLQLLQSAAPDTALTAFAPIGWRALPAKLCAAVGLDLGRCVSLDCFMGSTSTPGLDLAAQCKLTPERLAAHANPPFPPDMTTFGSWLQSIPRDGMVADVADPLSLGRLPINDKMVEAKGTLHVIWPALVAEVIRLREQEGRPQLALTEMQPLLLGVMRAEAERAATAAQVVAVARLWTALPASASGYLARSPKLLQAIKQLSSDAAEIEAAFKAAPVVPRLPDTVSPAIARGGAALAELRDEVTTLVASLPALAATDAIEVVADAACPATDTATLYMIAERPVQVSGAADGEARFKLALRQLERSEDGAITAELAAVITVPVRQVFDSKKNLAPQADWKCLAELQQIFPLGVTISHLREVEGKLRLEAPPGTLVQRTNVDRLREGLSNLLNRVDAVLPMPRSIELIAARLEFSADLRSVTLLTTVEVPLVGRRHEARVPLVVDGKLQSEPDIATLLDLNGLVAAFNAELSAKLGVRSVSLGPLTAVLRSVSIVPPERQDSANWLEARAELSAGTLGLGSIDLVVAEGDTPKIELSGDLTPAFRAALAGVIATQHALGEQMRAHLDQLAGDAEPFVAAVSKALLIQRVAMKDDQVLLTLGLDIGQLTGGDTELIEVTGPLQLGNGDLGLPPLYAELASKAVANGKAWINLAAQRLDAAAGQLIDAEIDRAMQAIKESAATVGLGLEFSARQADGSRTLKVSAFGESATIERVRIAATPPAVDFSQADLKDEDKRRLSAMVVSQVNSWLPLALTACGASRVTVGPSGIVMELSVETSLLGCIPLPGVAFDGARLRIDEKATVAAIEAVLSNKLTALLPSDVSEYVTGIAISAAEGTLVATFNAPVPGLGSSLAGTAKLNLKNGKVSIHIDDKDTLFNAAFKQVAGALGGDFSVELIPGRVGLRASGKVDLGITAIGVDGMELTPKGVFIPEVRITLPVAIAAGPFTIFPVEVRARVQRPYAITLIGDVGFAGTNSILMLRARFGFDNIPPEKLTVGGSLILVTVLELLRAEAVLDLDRRMIDGTSETVGLLKALMPMKQTMHIDEHEARMTTTATILGIDIDGKGRIVFDSNPDLNMQGTIDAGSLAQFSATLDTDLYLTDPRAGVSGSVDFKLGDISFDAEATLRRVRLRAEVIGIKASLTVPTLAGIDRSIIKALFEFLLHPSIDLEALAKLNINVSPRSGSGGDGVGGGDGDGGDDGNGGNGQGGGGTQAGDSEVKGGTPFTPIPGSYPVGTIPSEWQQAWLQGPAGYCEARYRGGEIKWFDNESVPQDVAAFKANGGPPRVFLGRSGEAYPLFDDCKDKRGERQGAATTLYFPDGATPVSWTQGHQEVVEQPWVQAVVQKIDARTPTRADGVSPTAESVLRFMFENQLQDESLVRRFALTNGSVFWIAHNGAGRILVLDPTHTYLSLRYEPDDPIGQWLATIIADDAGNAALRDSLLPLLFRGTQPVVLHASGEAPPEHLLVALRLADDNEVALPLKRVPDQLCADGVPAAGPILSGLWDPDGPYGPVMEELIQRGADCRFWTEIQVVGEDDAVADRVLLIRKDAAEWSIQFVDRLASTCMRSGLDSARLREALQQFVDLGAIDQAQRDQLVNDGLELVREAMASGEPNWREAGFPFNPLLLATCGAV